MSGAGEEALIGRAKAYIEDLFAACPGSHDAAHALRVYRTAMKLCDDLPEADRTLVALAALLHDADAPKLFSTKNNENARKFLQSCGADEDLTETVCRMINGVSFSKNGLQPPPTLEGRIVQDADRLDALGAVGAARTFAYGGEHGRPLEASIEHFHEKLLRLKDGMNTEGGRRLARERHAFLLAFLEEWEKETKE